MKRYPWPGNVRELENLVRRLCALHAEDVIGAELIHYELAAVGRADVPLPGSSADIQTAVEQHLTRLLHAHEPDLPPSGVYQDIIDKVEVPLISMILSACRGNQIRAAEVLGLNRNTLRKKIRTHQIDVVRQPRKP